MYRTHEQISQKIHYESSPGGLELLTSEMYLYAQRGDVSGVRPGLVVLSGGQKGCYSGGGAIALEELGLRNAFHTVTGISTGAPVVSYFVSGQSIEGTSIFYKNNTTKIFFDFDRGLNGGDAMNIRQLCDIFSGKVVIKN